MDITNNTSSTSSSSSWDLDIPIPMVIPNHSHPPFFHQFPLSNYDNFALNPNFHHQHHQLLPPSTSFPPTTHLELTHEELSLEDENQEEEGQLGAMKEMMYKIAAMQPVDIDPSTIKKPKRRNVRISDDPQSIAARHRRERISERIRILQRLVPGGTKMDTASMLDEAICYVKFLKRQVQELQATSPPVVGPLDYIAQGLVPSSSTTTSNMGGQLGLGFAFGGQGFSDRMG